jgi:hypothetical protein
LLRPKRNDKPVLLNLPKQILEEVDLAVSEQGVTRSQFLRQAVERNLRHYQRCERPLWQELEPNRQSDRRDRLGGRAQTAVDRLHSHAEKRSPLRLLARVHSHLARDNRHSEPRDRDHNDTD